MIEQNIKEARKDLDKDSYRYIHKSKYLKLKKLKKLINPFLTVRAKPDLLYRSSSECV